MRPSDILATFEPKGIAKLIREAMKRQEYRLKTPQGSVMERLVLEVMGKGRAAWRLHYDLGHGSARKRRKLKIGDKTTDLPTVRERWLTALKAIEAGNDPVGDQQTERLINAERSEMTMQRLVDDYLDDPEVKALRTIVEKRRILTKDVLPKLGKLPAVDIRPLDLEAMIERVSSRGAPVAARATFNIASAVFKWGIGKARWRAVGLTVNPFAQIAKPAAPGARTRKLSNDELRALWSVLDAGKGLEPGTADACRLVMILARRSKEVLQLPWCEIENIDTAEAIWRLPATRSKNEIEIVIPLPATALAILRRRKTENDARTTEETKPSAYVFPGPGADDAPLTKGALRTALGRLFVAADDDTPPLLTCPQFSPHDLRRTVAHRLAEELDVSIEMISAYLGHLAAGVSEKHYTQASKLKRLRRLADAWDAHLAGIVNNVDMAANSAPTDLAAERARRHAV